MSDVVPHIVSGILHSHRTLCFTAIAVICIAATPDILKDPVETKTFRYKTLQKIFEIHNVNLTLSGRFDRTDPNIGDDYYLAIVGRAFDEMAMACSEVYGLLDDAEPANLSIASRRIIEALAFTSRIIPDEIIHFGSLQTITAQPLPFNVVEQLSIIRDFRDIVHKARAFFKDAFRRPAPLTEDWQWCGFPSRSHFIRQVLVPISVTQVLGGAHYLRWLAVGLRKSLNPHGNNVTPFEAGSLIYDPERYLTLGSHNATRPHVPVKAVPWTSRFRGVWTHLEVGSYLKSMVHKQEVSVAGQILSTRRIQFESYSSQKQALAFRNLRYPSGRTIDTTLDKLPRSTKDNPEIQPKSSSKRAEIEWKQNVIAASASQGITKLEITKTSQSFRELRQKQYSTCPHCSIQICLPKDMERHVKTKHGRDGRVYYCPAENCKRSRKGRYPFDRLDNWRRHAQMVHKIPKPKDTDADAVATFTAQDQEI